MLDDLGRSIGTLLSDELPRVAERIEADGFDISFESPSRENAARLTRPTLNVYLFDIQENRELRRDPWQHGREGDRGTKRRPPVRLQCSYMITAWSSEVEDEHRLLAGAARALFRNPTLPAEVLEGALEGETEIPSRVSAPDEFKDVVDLWSVLDSDLKPSLRLVVTVPLELEVGEEGPLVLERELRFPPPTGIEPPPPPRRHVSVSGRVVRGGQPVPAARVRMDRSSATTRVDGTFDLRGVSPDSQAVLVAVDGTLFELEAAAPAGALPEGKDLELELAAEPEAAEASEGEEHQE